jgi:F420-dependent methylenetetrahydromethanopterin dehydrogenase
VYYLRLVLHIRHCICLKECFGYIINKIDSKVITKRFFLDPLPFTLSMSIFTTIFSGFFGVFFQERVAQVLYEDRGE